MIGFSVASYSSHRARGFLIALLLALLCAGCGGRISDNTGAPAAPSSALSSATELASGKRSVLDGATSDEKSSPRITIAAASDLRRVLTSLQRALEEASGAKVTFVFGSSGQLKEQVLAGADYTLFLSANTAYVEELERAGKVVPNGSAVYGVGRVTLAWRRGLPPLATISDLNRADVKRIAIANPAHAPYGQAAQEAMTMAGLWNALQDRLVLAENIRQATDYVQSGNVDAGIVALALVIDTDIPYTVIDARMHKPILQAGAVIRGTGGELSARRALQYLLDPPGQETLKKFGFELIP